MQKLTDNIYLLIIAAMGGTFMLVLSFAFLLSRNRNKLLRQKEQLRIAELEHQKELMRSVIESQEAERSRIGRDLHDDVGAALASLRIIIERFAREPFTVDGLSRLKAASKTIIAQITRDVRNISHNLSPEILTINTFPEAIEEFCAIVNDSGSMEVHFSNTAGDLPCRLNLTVALALYRVLEELVTNTIRHARAGRADIRFAEEQGMLVLDYSDNGTGLPAATEEKRGRGMQNIESRLGMIKAAYHLYPNTGSGYHIQVRVAVAADE